MCSLAQIVCRIFGHAFVGGEVTPPYKPPYCHRCGFVLESRAGITYAEFMGSARAVLESGVQIECGRIAAGTITTQAIKAGAVTKPKEN